jgi:3-hydroxyacyl-CoA dehydrogenase/enoyl-CoA hydratase/3-hydroxybutyryl-CoA epimerase
VIDKMVADGRLGRKNGKGFFKYGEDGKKTGADEAVYALIGAAQRKPMRREEIQDRLGLTMVNEAVRTLEEGVLHSARDGDVGAVMGIGFPPFRGGPFWYVDTVGAANVVERLGKLEQAHGKRFAAAQMLVDHARDGKKFFPDG